MSESPPSKRLAWLDGFRAIAACLVFLYHALPGTRYDYVLSKMALLGVSMFLVLSGYLIARPFIEWFLGERSEQRTEYYLRRRIGRIVPLYFVILLVIVTFSYLIPPSGFSSVHFTWQEIAKHVLFLQILAPRTFIDTFIGNSW